MGDSSTRITLVALLVASPAWCQFFGGGSRVGLTSVTFSNATSVTITHDANSKAVLVQCFNSSDQRFRPDLVTAATLNTVEVSFVAPRTGYCNVNAATAVSGGGGGGSGIVVSIGGQTNAIHVFAEDTNVGITSSGDPGQATHSLRWMGLLPGSRGGLGADASAFTGVLKMASGIAGVVPGSASDCVRVDATSFSCGPNAFATFSFASSVVVTHNANTKNVVSNCFDSADNRFQPASTVVALNAVTFSFSAVRSGYCVVNVSGGTGGGGGGGSVSSVFGRTGAVAAQTADYTFSQIGGALAASQIGSGDKHGNGAKLQTFTGTFSTNDCAKFDALGNLVSAGAACGSGGGGSTAGPGILVEGSVVRTDPTVVVHHLTATYSHDFPAIATGSCAQQPFTLAGAAVGQSGSVAVSAAAFPAGVNIQLPKVTATNTVAVEICNFSGASYDPSVDRSYTVSLKQ